MASSAFLLQLAVTEPGSVQTTPTRKVATCALPTPSDAPQATCACPGPPSVMVSKIAQMAVMRASVRRKKTIGRVGWTMKYLTSAKTLNSNAFHASACLWRRFVTNATIVLTATTRAPSVTMPAPRHILVDLSKSAFPLPEVQFANARTAFLSLPSDSARMWTNV